VSPGVEFCEDRVGVLWFGVNGGRAPGVVTFGVDGLEEEAAARCMN
jgi:hypothetical protein